MESVVTLRLDSLHPQRGISFEKYAIARASCPAYPPLAANKVSPTARLARPPDTELCAAAFATFTSQGKSQPMLHFPSIKSSRAKPAPPVFSMVNTPRASGRDLFTDICDTVRREDPSPALRARYEHFRQEAAFSQSVEDLLSFSMHKHAIKRVGEKQQKSIYKRLTSIVPQPFTLKEVIDSQRPMELREQLRRAQAALAQAKVDKAKADHDAKISAEASDEIASHLNERLHERNLCIEDQARQIASLQTNLAAQHELYNECRTLEQKQREWFQLRESSLMRELEEAYGQVDEMHEEMQSYKKSTREFLRNHLREEQPREARSRRNSTISRRPYSMVVSSNRVEPNRDQRETNNELSAFQTN